MLVGGSASLIAALILDIRALHGHKQKQAYDGSLVCDLTLIAELVSESVAPDQVEQEHKHPLHRASSLS